MSSAKPAAALAKPSARDAMALATNSATVFRQVIFAASTTSECATRRTAMRAVEVVFVSVTAVMLRASSNAKRALAKAM